MQVLADQLADWSRALLLHACSFQAEAAVTCWKRVSGVVWLAVVVIAPLAAAGHHPLPTQNDASCGLDE
jgi:hypothetical protein